MSTTSTLPSNPAEDSGHSLRLVTVIFTVVSVLVMSARLFVRAHIIRAVGIDDWIMTFVTLIAVAGMGIVLAQIQHGAGRHIGDVPPRDYAKGLELNFVTQLMFLYGICFAKLAVGASLFRIASTKLWKHVILGCMIFAFAYTTVGFATILAQCSDIRANWDFSVESRCWSAQKVQIASHINFSLNIATDLAFALVVPLCMLWRVNMSWRTKMSLFLVLGLGCFVSACAVVRILYLGSYGEKGDWLWDTVPLATWSVIELNTGIIAGSLPSLRPLAKRFLGSIYASGTTARQQRYYGAGTSSARSRPGSKHWTALASREGRGGGGGGGGGVNGHAHPAMPTLGPPRPAGNGTLLLPDDAGSLKQLHQHASSHGSAGKASFELPCYRVEAHVTSGEAMRVSDQFPVGITKTTYTTVSYDKSSHV